MNTVQPPSFPWWTSAVIYHIYPRSFQDSNGDGVGDLNGIRNRLDYLTWLGIDALWLSPIFPSPMEDFGYDITDYSAIDPLFGTLADFDAFLTEAHARELRVILDFVPNHTSRQHPWFLASRSSHSNSKRDWYLWRDPAPDGGPPNNWHSGTGSSAWTFDEATGQYYLHSFLSSQPDLNWRHPDVRVAMFNTIRFWLSRGVDGLRIDMIEFLLKDAAFRDEPIIAPLQSYAFPEARYHLNRPETLDLIRELRAEMDEYPQRVSIGEVVPHLPVAKVLTYYGNGDLLHLPFNFALLSTPWTARDVGAVICEYDAALPTHAWPNYTLGNHDTPRLATRLGPEQVRLAAMLLLTVRGTPFLYYGDELGLPNISVAPERIQDPWEQIQPGAGRDPERAPMPWNTEPYYAGFSSVEPWLPQPSDVGRFSVATQQADSTSILHLYRQLIALHHTNAALRHGDLHVLTDIPEHVLAYRRSFSDQTMLVALNFDDAPLTLPLPDDASTWKIRLSTHQDREEVTGRFIVLYPFEGILLEQADPLTTHLDAGATQ